MRYLVIGHGEFPQGVQSAIQLLLGDKVVDSINLTAEKTHLEFKKEVEQYLQKNEDIIVFADLTGGAPHQIVGEILHKKLIKNWYLISNVTLSIVMETCLMVQMEPNPQNYETIIQQAIATGKNSILLLKK